MREDKPISKDISILCFASTANCILNSEHFSSMPKTSKKMSRRKPSADTRRIVLHRRSVNVIAKNSADYGAAYVLDLSAFNSSDILSLFSEYRILSVTATHQLVNAPNNNASFPRLHIAQRGFSNVAPTSRNEVLQYNGLKMYQFGPANISVKQKFKPYVWLDAVNSVTGTGKRIIASPWIATDSDTVRHNFAVVWYDRYNTTTDPTHTLELILDIVIEARGPR